MSRRAPNGPPLTRPSWVYLLHFDVPFPQQPVGGGHQVRHYSGKSEDVPARMAVHASGGDARLMQLLKEAGGTFRPAALEYGTGDTETRMKYRGAGSRCLLCQGGPELAGDHAADPAWVYILRLEQPGQAGPGLPGLPGLPDSGPAVHHVGVTSGTAALLAATGRGGRAADGLLPAPASADGGTWRLVWARRDPLGTGAAVVSAGVTVFCPCCRASREQAEAAAVLAAIAGGEVAYRLDPATGEWSVRRHTRDGRPLRSRGPGGHLGRKVPARAAAALVRRGLARRAKVPDPGGDYPYLVTRTGRKVLRAASPEPGRASAPRPGGDPGRPGRRQAGPFCGVYTARADGLPVNQDGSLSRSQVTEAEIISAGAMTRAASAAHRDLVRAVVSLEHPDLLQRLSGPLPADPWTTPIPPAQPAAPAPVSPGPDPSWPASAGAGIAAAAARAALPRPAAWRPAGPQAAGSLRHAR
ncbi:MAG: hypothetical protein ACRDPD_21720 [Streptosporangiaceae bacterium]